ncbi:MAG: helix-turn-helix domain-containing protein [Clostridium sp.]|nr:helix-turn-helix domain-containing protein [Clostridium sp.]
MKQTLMDLLNKMIEEQHVNRSELCRGLCSGAALSRYLSGERRMDRLLLSALMQRLGKSPDKFVSLLTDAEYRYFDWRMRLLNSVADGELEEAECLLSEGTAVDAELNEPVQRQFYLMMRGVLQEKLHGDKEGAMAFYDRAVRETIPDFAGKLRQQSFLCVQEINVLLLWQEYLGDGETFAGVLDFLINYVYRHFGDEQELVKVYPRLAAKYLPYLRKKECYGKMYDLSKRAFEMMTSLYYFVCEEQILGAYIESAEKIGKAEEVAKRKVQLASWSRMKKELQEDLGIFQRDEWHVWDLWQEAELLREVVERRRRQQGMSQEALSEDICTPETLSRIETGKRAPSRRNFQALAKKLGVREDYYYSVIETDDFQLLEECLRIDGMIETRQWQKAKETAEHLEQQLDMENCQNRQYLGAIRYILGLYLDDTPQEERIGRLITLLNLTIPEIPLTENVREWPEAFWCTVFTSEEISIMSDMVQELRHNGKQEDSFYLLEKLYEYYKRSTVRPEFHFRTFMRVLAWLSIFLGTSGRYEECVQCSREGIALCFVSRKMTDMGLFVNDIANAKECLGDKTFALRYYRYAFYCEELLGRNTEVPKRSYEKLSGEEAKWY